MRWENLYTGGWRESRPNLKAPYTSTLKNLFCPKGLRHFLCTALIWIFFASKKVQSRSGMSILSPSHSPLQVHDISLIGFLSALSPPTHHPSSTQAPLNVPSLLQSQILPRLWNLPTASWDLSPQNISLLYLAHTVTFKYGPPLMTDTWRSEVKGYLVL